jgi:transposase
MKNDQEHEKRRKAVELYQQGKGFEKILQIIHRSRGWLSKWLGRLREQGLQGLQDQSRAPKHVWRKTAPRLEQKILAIRKELESHKTRRSTFAGIGTEVIQWELKQRKMAPIPSISTLTRILAKHGCTKKGKKPKSKSREPYPAFRVEQIGDLHQTDLVGPRYLRGPKGVTRFYSFHTVDVAGHAVATTQFRDKQALSLCSHLVSAWKRLGLPRGSQMDNEMAAAGGGRYPYSLSQVIRLHLLVGIQMVFIPTGEPGRNACVESFNHLWQERVLRRHSCPTLVALRRLDQRFLNYYHYHKPHRALTQADHATRFPGVLRDRHWRKIRHIPGGFCLKRYRDSRGHLHLPMARGRVSWIRKVDGSGYIEVNGNSYFIRRALAGQYVVATLFTHRQNLVIKQQGRRTKSYKFPILEPRITPLVPFPKGKPL